MMIRPLLAIAVVLPLLGCGPMPLPEAERQCLQKARLAAHPRGSVSIGVNSNGQVGGGIDLSVSSDYLSGRDPAEVYKTCVKQKSGQFPSRALEDQPGWSR